MSTLKNCAKRTVLASARRFGYDIVTLKQNANQSEEAHRIDVLGLIVGTFKPRFFVQVGANDGVRVDPMRRLILGWALPGLLVEPIPLAFDKLRQNYASQPQLLFEQSAVSDTDGIAVMSLPNGDSEAATLLQVSNSPFKVEQIQVVLVSPETLLKKHRIDKSTLDLLVVDAEGWDARIVKAFLDVCSPAIIQFENYLLSEDTRESLSRHLHGRGYATLVVGIDTIALKTPR